MPVASEAPSGRGRAAGLIELSQDQLARDLGPRGEEVRAAFVAGDTRGVLESLGQANDDQPFSDEKVARLWDVVEETEGENY